MRPIQVAKIFVAFVVAVSASTDSLLHSEEVTQFRGSNGDGIVLNATVPTSFSETDNVVWRTEIPGKGWSSPVVADGKIWLTTAIEEVLDQEEQERLISETTDKPKQVAQKQVAASLTLDLVQIDAATGAIDGTVELFHVDEPDPIHKTNSYASPTPVIDEDRLYCHFGTYGTVCLDRNTLTMIWERVIPLEHEVGPGSSPFVYQDLLILICDGVDRQFVLALNKMTGETVWEVDRPEMDAPSGDQKKSYNTPVAVVDSKGREQLICMGSQWLVSYDPPTGKELWKVYHGKGFSVVPRPVILDETVYISTGFGKAQLWAVRIDGEGDVTDSHVLWTEKSNIPTKPSPLVVGDQVFVINDTGIASSFDAKSGKPSWRGRIGGNYSASPILVNGQIIVASQEGLVSFLDPADDFETVSENQLSGQIMASPIVLENTLIIRTDSALYRFQDPEGATSQSISKVSQ